MRHFKIIACEIFRRELEQAAAVCPNELDITFIKQELHTTPRLLRETLQKEIDAAEFGGKPDAILLCYGLCSNAVTGIGGKRTSVVIPRAHDCITYFMGSKERYAEYFAKVSGSFYYTQGWLELGQDIGTVDIERKRSEYMERFDGDEESVEYLLEMDREMLKSYRYLTYITWPGFDNQKGIKKAQKRAEDSGLELLQYEGSDRLLIDLVNGNWDEEAFLILQPGEVIRPSYNELIITGE